MIRRALLMRARVRSAISLYLAGRGVVVRMVTSSRERFEGIVADCPAEHRHKLHHTPAVEVRFPFHVASQRPLARG